MKLIEQSQATDTLAHYAEKIDAGPVIVTIRGKPVAALVPIGNADLESLSLSTNPKFLKLIAKSRASTRSQGSISSSEMRQKFTKKRRPAKP